VQSEGLKWGGKADFCCGCCLLPAAALKVAWGAELCLAKESGRSVMLALRAGPRGGLGWTDVVYILELGVNFD